MKSGKLIEEPIDRVEKLDFFMVIKEFHLIRNEITQTLLIVE
jgi:hypothetical protein